MKSNFVEKHQKTFPLPGNDQSSAGCERRNCQRPPGRRCAASPCTSAADESQNSCSYCSPCCLVNSGASAAASPVSAGYLPCHDMNSGTKAPAPASAAEAFVGIGTGICC